MTLAASEAIRASASASATSNGALGLTALPILLRPPLLYKLSEMAGRAYAGRIRFRFGAVCATRHRWCYRARRREQLMQDQKVDRNLKGMDDLDFDGCNKADWDGVFAHHHTDDVLVDWKGLEPTRGIAEHIAACKAFVDSVGGTPPQISSHPIAFGSGDWTCVIGEFADGSRMVTVAKWRDGAIAEEYIWA
jgi:hypothetical protein